ncbi:MAG: glycosyltransferase family 2 protein [Hyphomonas sp.]
MNKNIDVSVIIPAYEASAFIGTAVQNCLSQTGVTFEVIVVDDGSVVSSEQAVADVAKGDPRVKFFQLKENSGPAVARNVALKEAQGRYIAVLDADDEMLLDRLAVMVTKADEAGLDIIVDQMVSKKFGQEKSSGDTFLNDFGPDPIEITLLDYVDVKNDEKFGDSLGYLKPMFRTEFLRTHSIEYKPELRNSEDYYIVAEMLVHGARMLWIPYAGYIYTIREGSLSYRLSAQKAFAVVYAEEEFQKTYADKMSDAVKHAARGRLDRAKKIAEFELMVEGLRTKSMASTLRGFFSSPTHIPYHVSELFMIAGKKLSARS